MSTISVPIPSQTFLDLADFLRGNGSDRDPVEVIETAVDYWMDNAAWKPEIVTPDRIRSGYSWKSVFLPSGTNLRIRYNSDYHYAKVEGDRLIYERDQVSPNQFARKVAGCQRDAWRDLWIKRPADKDYVVANELRKNQS